MVGFRVWGVRTYIPKPDSSSTHPAFVGPTSSCSGSVISARGKGCPKAVLRSKLPVSPVLFLVLVTPGHWAWVCYEDSELKYAMDNPHWEIATVSGKWCSQKMVNFKIFHFSSKMTKLACAHRLNIKNSFHLEGCVTGRTFEPENNLFSCIPLLKFPVHFFLWLMWSWQWLPAFGLKMSDFLLP